MLARVLLLPIVAALLVRAEPLLLPGSAELSTSKLTRAAHLNRYAGSAWSDSAAREMYHEEVHLDAMVDENGKRVFRLVKQTYNATFALVDTLVFRKNGLTPIVEHMHSGALTRTILYHGDSVEVVTQSGDSAPVIAGRRFHSPVFGFNQLEQIVQSLPLRAGYTAILPLYSEGSGEREMDTVTVIGKDAVAGSWMIRFADQAIVSTYGVDAMTREVKSYEVEPRSGGRFFRMN